ncbi:MAG: hypothetical protein IIU80_02255 [Clostridia bacterium]|nr:hypothetical protein [Clostridia bacterium]
MLPTKWGQGQLFAFSALDGESFFRDDFTGTLAGDKIGVIFHTKCRRTLFLTDAAHDFSCVTSDMLLLKNASVIFAGRHLVVGEIGGAANVFVSVDGDCEIIKKADTEIHDTSDGEFTAVLKRNGRFAFAFAKGADEAAELCEKGMSLDPEKLKAQKKKPYEGIPEDMEYAALYAKCVSVMKSQLYSPEGNIKRIWSTPDRLPHRNMWLWDSVFHAIGHRHLDAKLAENLILALFDVQQDGYIPHMATPDFCSGVTQPPVIAWGSWMVYEKSSDKEFLKTVFEKNKAFLLWCRSNRRKSAKELYSWHTKPELNNRCDESGMDNSPRFDTASDLYAIDFSCYMANETRAMQKIASELGDKDGEAFFAEWNEKIKSDINATLWCDEDGFYYDYDIQNGCFNKVQSVASFLPVFAGVCDERQCERLVAHLENPGEFGTELPIPSISKKDATFGSDMWRGPVWINYNYMISMGLKEYGYCGKAEEIVAKTLAIINEWYSLTGTVFEFYDSENRTPPYCFNRKGEIVEPYDFRLKYQSIRDYGWTSTLALDMICEK